MKNEVANRFGTPKGTRKAGRERGMDQRNGLYIGSLARHKTRGETTGALRPAPVQFWSLSRFVLGDFVQVRFGDFIPFDFAHCRMEQIGV